MLLAKLVKFFTRDTRELEAHQTGLQYGPTVSDWAEIDCAPKLTKGLFYSTISWTINGHWSSAKWLRHEHANGLWEESIGFWCKRKAGGPLVVLADLRKVLTTNFLREADRQAFHAKVANAIAPWPKELRPEFFADGELEALTELQEMADWTLKEFQRVFVDEETTRYAEFFDHVESQPLTKRQREACVKDEENNLVLAGAGTGKTSTLLGRVGYLLESGRAKPNEILLLAYGKAAATEMDERISGRLGGVQVKTKTFHALGMEIIAQVEGEKPTVSPLATDQATMERWAQDQLGLLLQDSSGRGLVLEYLAKHMFPGKNAFDFESQGEYYEFLRVNKIRTLKGEHVKGFGELSIANWLYLNGVKYAYEPRYKVNTATLDFRAYQPDFHLPDEQIYIEHWGVDTDGSTAP
jgi:DNA helicase IV